MCSSSQSILQLIDLGRAALESAWTMQVRRRFFGARWLCGRTRHRTTGERGWNGGADQSDAGGRPPAATDDVIDAVTSGPPEPGLANDRRG